MKDFRDWQGKAVLDREGRKVGNIGQLYVDDRDDAPTWATVRTNEGENFFPVSMAHVNGDDIVIDMPVEDVTRAPRISPRDEIDTDEEMELYNYYRQKWSDNTGGANLSDDDLHDPSARSTGSTDDAGSTHDNMSGSNDHDDSINKGSTEQQRVHLRRYTITELMTDDGEVTRKEVTIEKQPISEEDMQDMNESGGR